MIETTEQAREFIKNLKRSDNWISDGELFEKLQQCESLIKHDTQEELLPYLGVNFCLYYIDISDYKNAWNYAEIAIKYAEKYENTECLLNALSLQHRIHRLLGNLEAAQISISKQIELAHKYNAPNQLAGAYLNQAVIFHKQRLKSNTKEAYLRAIEYVIKSNNLFYIATYHISYAGVLIDFKEEEEALPFLKKGFDIAQKNNFSRPLAIAYSNYGLIYQTKGEEEKCINAYKTSIQLFEEIQSSNDAIMAKIMLADAYIAFNHLEKSENILNETIEFSERNDLKYNQIGIYEALSALMEKREHYQDALKYHKKLIEVKEEYLNAESEKRIQNVEQHQRINILKIEKQNAENMANLKHDFLANMSHEIRTPINSILGICYLLQQQSLNTVQFDYINRLKRSGENLLGIVNDVLDISKIESGKMDLVHEPISIYSILQDVHQSLEPKATDKKIAFTVSTHFEKEFTVISDPVRLYQVLLNLASNALKFTIEGFVSIEARITNKKNKFTEITFIVKDSGIGIAQEKINRIFERYEQADASIKNTFGGTGLGLSISKKIVELMHGTIDAKSELNKGTEFIVSIPFETSLQQAPAAFDMSSISIESTNNICIVIADDNTENRLIAREILLNFNPSIKIMEAENGQEVLQMINANTVNIIFMDFDMPIMNGIEAAQAIRANVSNHSIKIIGNTASLITLSIEEIKSLGFDDFIPKPFKPEELIKKIVYL